jgi:hypothetical protein
MEGRLDSYSNAFNWPHLAQGIGIGLVAVGRSSKFIQLVNSVFSISMFAELFLSGNA